MLAQTQESTALPIETTVDMPHSRRERWKHILKLAWPLIVANSFWNLQLTIDRVFLGNYSTDSLAAAMAVMGIFWTPMALVQQTAAYVMTFIAQYLGAKEPKMIGPAVWHAIYLSVIGGLLVLLFIPFSDAAFSWIGHSPNLQGAESAYFKALCWSALPTALVAVASGYFTGLGDTKVIIGINAVGFVGNVVFDYLMIFGKFGFPTMGVAGAGYATAMATWLAAIYGLWLVMKRVNEEKYHVRSGWKWNSDLMRRFIRYGIPSGMQWALEGLAFTVFLIIVGRMSNGDAALAASGIVVTVMMLSVLPAMGVAQAVAVLMGQYLGDKKPNQAEIATWTGLQIALAYIVSVGVTFLLFPQFYLSWFHNPENAVLWSEVSRLVPYLLMYVALFTCFDCMNFVFSFALKGAGDTRFVTLIALSLPWPIMVLPTFLTADWRGAIFWAWGFGSVYSCTQAVIFWRRFVGAKWKAMSVIH